jgi:hypothetical protein
MFFTVSLLWICFFSVSKSEKEIGTNLWAERRKKIAGDERDEEKYSAEHCDMTKMWD